ncbi:TIGR03089 family protein [Streptomyces sp. NPDC059740]|uniref:TIGR03089 family protein n=1 Tax=Streptomyces sp. NPDC059740 TaxID=3346926 RepID=UPI003663196E
MNATDRTPAATLRSALAADPARPLLTFYDDATGERVELSVATFDNWVAKTANYLQSDLAAEPGDTASLLLPAHWLTAVWLLACSSVGVVADVAGDPAGADLVVTGPDELERARTCKGERVALSLRPLGGRFPQPPQGFADYAAEVPGHGDRFTALAPVDPDEPALRVAGRELTGAQVVQEARADAGRLGLTAGSRLLSTRPYDSWEGLSAGLLAPLTTGGSVVLVRHAEHLDAEALERRRTDERVTHSAS